MTRTPTFPRGGIQVPARKAATRDAPITNASVPPVATVPLRQHVGAPAECLVKPGDVVAEGQLIGRAVEKLSAAVHAPIPGRVAEVREVVLADGSRCSAVVIELGGEFQQSGRPPKPWDWHGASPAELLALVREAGVVGLGGEPVPVAPKWQAARERGPETLVANAIEGEPFLAAEHRLLLERPAEVAEAIRIAQRALGCRRIVLAVIEETAEAGRETIEILRREGIAAELAAFQDRWPQGEESQLAAALCGDEAPPTADAFERGMVMASIATLVAVREAVALGRPLIERVITVAGPGVREPRNLKVRSGTPIGELIEEAGGLARRGDPIVIGGPMRGAIVEDLSFPVTRTVSGVLVLPHARDQQSWPCIRCGRCVDACPWGLSPVRLSKAAASGLLARARALGLEDCRACGCCSYVCPSRIPIVDILKAARR